MESRKTIVRRKSRSSHAHLCSACHAYPCSFLDGNDNLGSVVGSRGNSTLRLTANPEGPGRCTSARQVLKRQKPIWRCALRNHWRVLPNKTREPQLDNRRLRRWKALLVVGCAFLFLAEATMVICRERMQIVAIKALKTAAELIDFARDRGRLTQRRPDESFDQYEQRISNVNVETQSLYSKTYGSQVSDLRSEPARRGLRDAELDELYQRPDTQWPSATLLKDCSTWGRPCVREPSFEAPLRSCDFLRRGRGIGGLSRPASRIRP